MGGIYLLYIYIIINNQNIIIMSFLTAHIKETPTPEDRIATRAFNLEQQRHHLARLAMMMAEERGEDLSYESALKQ